MKKSILTLAAALAVFGSAHAQLYFTQYYEGPSTNKWLELTNVGSTTIDLSTYAVGQWNNASTEGYKTGAAPNFTMTLSGTLNPGQSLLLYNTSNTTPAYALAYTPKLSNNSVINFNGNDSLGLYTAGTYSTSALIDAIGFTNSGNEGVDKSFVRTSLNPGFDLAAGSDILDFSSVWTNTVLADVNNATASTNNYLGYSSLSVVPEPHEYGIALAAMLGVMVWMRRRRASVA